MSAPCQSSTFQVAYSLASYSNAWRALHWSGSWLESFEWSQLRAWLRWPNIQVSVASATGEVAQRLAQLEVGGQSQVNDFNFAGLTEFCEAQWLRTHRPPRPRRAIECR